MRWPYRRRDTRSNAATGRGRRSCKSGQVRFAHVQAITHFARALGAARSGNAENGKADIAKLAELRDKLREAKDAYWTEQVDIQWQVASAWALYAEGKYDDALKTMSAATDAEDKTEKHPVTPGVPTPARELYGTMLLERGMAREALVAFEATLKKQPYRLGATLGAAKAAEKAGDTAKARQYYMAAVTLDRKCRSGQAADRGGASVRGQEIGPGAYGERWSHAMRKRLVLTIVVVLGFAGAAAGYLIMLASQPLGECEYGCGHGSAGLDRSEMAISH